MANPTTSCDFLFHSPWSRDYDCRPLDILAPWRPILIISWRWKAFWSSFLTFMVSQLSFSHLRCMDNYFSARYKVSLYLLRFSLKLILLFDWSPPRSSSRLIPSHRNAGRFFGTTQHEKLTIEGLHLDTHFRERSWMNFSIWIRCLYCRVRNL